MGFIFGRGLTATLSRLLLTASSENSAYPVINVINYRNLLRHYRSLVATEVTIVGAWGAGKRLMAIMLNDINFTTFTLQLNNGNTWGAPAYSANFTSANDIRVDRRKAYCVLNIDTFTHFRLVIPAQTPTDGLSVFRIGTLIPIEQQFELTQNPSMGYSWGVRTPEHRLISYASGQTERSSRGSMARLTLSMSFDPYLRTNVGQIYTMSQVDKSEPVALYENDLELDTSRCVLAYRNNDIDVSWSGVDTVSINRLDFEEVI